MAPADVASSGTAARIDGAAAEADALSDGAAVAVPDGCSKTGEYSSKGYIKS